MERRVTTNAEGLAPKLIKTELASYERQLWQGENLSGYEPLGDLVLVMIDKVARKTQGGIELPPELIERMDLAAETGVIVAKGEGAFVWSADRRRPWTGAIPKDGERVYLERYAGQLITGDDGLKYRLVPDRQIGAKRK